MEVRDRLALGLGFGDRKDSGLEGLGFRIQDLGLRVWGGRGCIGVKKIQHPLLGRPWFHTMHPVQPIP